MKRHARKIVIGLMALASIFESKKLLERKNQLGKIEISKVQEQNSSLSVFERLNDQIEKFADSLSFLNSSKNQSKSMHVVKKESNKIAENLKVIGLVVINEGKSGLTDKIIGQISNLDSSIEYLRIYANSNRDDFSDDELKQINKLRAWSKLILINYNAFFSS